MFWTDLTSRWGVLLYPKKVNSCVISNRLNHQA